MILKVDGAIYKAPNDNVFVKEKFVFWQSLDLKMRCFLRYQ